MESLVPVMVSGEDVAVGVSGFGSAKVDVARWSELGVLTGRTTYLLSYDAQDLPWAQAAVLPVIVSAAELYRRWSVAREGARVASNHLARWLARWTRAGRRVLLVGFSLGGLVVWNAVRSVAREYWHLIDIVLVSAAVADTDSQWVGAESLASISNVYSLSDPVLKFLYPRGVSSDETPAAGLGPIRHESVRNLDLTDRIGMDHFWGGANMRSILRTVLGSKWTSEGSTDEISGRGLLDPSSIERLSSWVPAIPEYSNLLGEALAGDELASSKLVALDRWSCSDGRFPSLVNAARTYVALSSTRHCQSVSERSRAQIEGLIRHWVQETIRRDHRPK